MYSEIPMNLLQGDQPQSHQAFQIFFCNHASVKVQASCPACLEAVSTQITNHKTHPKLNK